VSLKWWAERQGVSCADQEAGLDWRVARVTGWAAGEGLAAGRVVTEVRDVTDILSSLCARLFGQCAARNRAARAVRALGRAVPG
jgi:predicted site-specific integrase-resolvase